MRDFYTKENMQGASFHVPDDGLTFEPAELSFETEAETGREGVIRVVHKGGKPARGYVYPSERCMRGVREQFAPAADGKGYIRWQFDSRGIAPGRTINGFFRVISPYGEYRIPYSVRISGTGEIPRRKNLQGKASEQLSKKNVDFSFSEEQEISYSNLRTKADFLALAEEDFELAADFFYSSRFINILTKDEDKTLYRGLSMQKNNLQNVEEFLITACGKKKTVFEPVEKSLFLQTEGKAGRTDNRMAGSRAERALEAHRQRVRSRGLGGAPVRQQQAVQEDLVYIPLQIRKIGTGYAGLTIQAEGRFLPSAPFDVPVAEAVMAVNPADDATSGEGTKNRADTAEAVNQSDRQADQNAAIKANVSGVSGRTGTQSGVQSGQKKPGFGAPETKEPEWIFTVRIPVNRAALHAGRNFGRVIVRGPFNETAVPVEVHCLPSTPPVRRRQERELHLLELQLMRLYVDFRLTDKRAHADLEMQADRLIDEISMRSHRDLIPRLYRVHMLILRGQNAEAERELARIAVRYAGTDAAQNTSARFTGEQEDAYCYRQYLYARCRLEDAQLRSRVVRFLKGVYRSRNSWQTAWMLMDLSEEYAPGTGARWNFLRHQYENGCNSPVIWIDAWEMVRSDPRILLPGSSVQERWVKDDFGLLVLWYAARNNVLTEKAAEVMISLAEKKKNFSLLLYKALCAAYEVDALGEMRRQLMRAICILLIRGQDLSPKAHAWYKRAEEMEVNLTNLEEYRQRSTPPDDSAFRLPAGCNAILRTTAQRAQRAVLIYDRFRREEVFPINGGAAPMTIYGDANTIFLEDADGNRYAESLPYAVDVQKKESSAGFGAGSARAAAKGSSRSVIQVSSQGTVQAASSGKGLKSGFSESENPRELAVRIGFGERGRRLSDLTRETAAEAGKLLDSGLLTTAARTELLLQCLQVCREHTGRAAGFNAAADSASSSNAVSSAPLSNAAASRAGGNGTASNNKTTGNAGGTKTADAGRIAVTSTAAASRAGGNSIASNTKTIGRAGGNGTASNNKTAGSAGGTKTADAGRIAVTSNAAASRAGGNSIAANTKTIGNAGGNGTASNNKTTGSAGGTKTVSGTGGYAGDQDIDFEELTRFFLQKADPGQCSPAERALLLKYLEEAGEYERAVTWLLAYGNEAVDARLLGKICLGLPWEGGYETAVVPIGWEAFMRGNTDGLLLGRLSGTLPGLSDELCTLRKACLDNAVSTRELDIRIVRQVLYSGALSKEHAPVIVSAGERLGEAFLPVAAQYSDFAFSGGISMGSRMTDLVVSIIAEGREPLEDICRIAVLKELSMRQGEFTDRERRAASASLSALLSKGIIFPFYRQFPGFDDRLDLYAEETLVQYHAMSPEEGSGKHVLFHYTTSRRGETGSYRSRPMKEMYRNFFVSGFLLFYGEQMHYYITDDPQEKHVVQSGMIGQDARILENCSGRFGLINETTRAAALRDYDEALSLLTGYYRRSYLENELFRR